MQWMLYSNTSERHICYHWCNDTHGATPVHQTCVTAALTGAGATRQQRSSLWTVVLWKTLTVKSDRLLRCFHRACDYNLSWSILKRYQVEGNVMSNSSPGFWKWKQISYCCVYHTQVVVLRDSCGSSGARSLLGEVVAKLHYAGVLLQHFSYFHLYSSTQLLPLKYTDIQKSGSVYWSQNFTLVYNKIEHRTQTVRIWFNFSPLLESLKWSFMSDRQWFVLIGNFFNCMLRSTNIFYNFRLCETTLFIRLPCPCC